MNISSTETFEEENFLLNRIKFVLFLTLEIPSSILYVIILTFYCTHRGLLHTPQNQALLLLLIVNFIQASFDLPMAIRFYYLGRISPATSAYCTWWTFLDYTLLAESEFLMVTISIQRHILVFQKHLLRIPWKRWLLHYLPLLFCLLYPIVLYLIIVVFYPCDGTDWDFTSNLCGLANCYLLYNTVLSTFDWSLDTGAPVLIILLANAALVIRVIHQKHRRQQIISWRKQRHMTLQLVSISGVYLITLLPSVIIALVQQIALPDFAIQIQTDFILDLTYIICLVTPWACLRMTPELTKWISKKFHFWKTMHNTVRVRPV